MFSHLRQTLLVSFSLAAIVTACRETGPVGVATTTGAALTDESAALRVAKARCRRAGECNRFGYGHMYADESQCLEAYREHVLPIAETCPGGIDKSRLDNCLATLATQHCDADMGPVTAMPDCDSYCFR